MRDGRLCHCDEPRENYAEKYNNPFHVHVVNAVIECHHGLLGARGSASQVRVA